MEPRTYLKKPFKCESWADEYDMSVLLRKHSHSYGDERNWRIMPSGQFVAERDS